MKRAMPIWEPDRKSLVVAMAIALAGVLGLADYITGWEISFSVFYLVPIVLVSWKTGGAAGYAIAFLCALTWGGIEFSLHEFSSPFILIWNGSVRLSFFLIVSFLVNARRVMESSLADREERLRLLMDSTAEAIVGVDVRGEITFCNPSGASLLGYSAVSDILGKNIGEMAVYSASQEGASTARSPALVRSVEEARAAHVPLATFRRADGSTLPVEYWCHPVVKDGLSAGAVVTFLDITDRLKVERMKNEFISSVSHELRTPLTSIMGSLGLIAGGVAGGISEQARELVQMAYRNSERLVRLISDILDLQRVESGRMEFTFQAIDPVEIARQSVESTRSYGDQFGVRFALSAPEEPMQIKADADRLTQVVVNLLANAAKFSREGDRVDVRISLHDGRVRIGVSDHGPGIPREQAHRIFDRFVQLDASDSRAKGGTGLGLSICKALVERMGGRIGFESRPDEETTFFVEFAEYSGGAMAS